MPDAAPWMERPTMPDPACQSQQSGWLQLYQSVTDNDPHALYGLRFQNHDHAVHKAAPQGSFGGSVQNSDAIAVNPEYGQGSGTLEYAPYKTTSETAEDNQQDDFDVAPPATRSESRNAARKRDRDKNWTDDETSVLVECKKLAFRDKASPFRKQKSRATNWEAICKEVRNNRDTRASEKTADQCRLRWDTLVKSHRKVKERCMETKKGYAELMEEEMSDLKLATTLKEEWYEVIDTISRKSWSRKRDYPPSSIGGFANHEGIIENVPAPVSSLTTPVDLGSPPLLFQRPSSASTQKSPQVPSGRPDLGSSSRKQIAIPGFSSLAGQLRSTLLDLVLGRRFLRDTWRDSETLSDSCRWLSIVQNRSCSDIYNDVSMLVKMELVHLSADDGALSIDKSYFRIFDKFVKKVLGNNPVYDTHRHIKLLDDTEFISAKEFSVPQRIRVLKLERCSELERVDFRGLRKLRSLFIAGCPMLREVTGWKFLRDLGWLEIVDCESYHDYPDLRVLLSLRDIRFGGQDVSDCPPRHDLDISQCVRLRRLEIWCDAALEESGDLSSLVCLEILMFGWCKWLSTITGFSGLHSLTSLELTGCKELRSLPDMGHMKELECVSIPFTGLEEIPGIEKLVSLKTLDCSYSRLKHLPDLHHLPNLQEIFLADTPLIEDDPSSFYFDKSKVPYNREETGRVDFSDISDGEYSFSDSSNDED